MSSRAEIYSLAFLHRDRTLTDEEQAEREQQTGDDRRDIEKNDLPEKPEDKV